MSQDELYMYRCLQLAECGRLKAKPNPMVGAVIVADGRIIGEGYHECCGQGHAEVNAFASVKPCDEHLLSSATIYVSLEPCSHYGKTPPCAELIVKKGVERVVVGCVDPFAKVQGRGINRIREAGIKVDVGVLEKECLRLNRHFITFNTKHRPYVLLKWAQSEDGFIDDNGMPTMLSTPFTQMLSHRLRAEYDAILVGRVTAERDRPSLTTRHWSGKSPLRIMLTKDDPIVSTLDPQSPLLPQLMDRLYDMGIQSLIVEGGAKTHQSFLEAGLADEIRREVSPRIITSGTRAIDVPLSAERISREEWDGNVIENFILNSL